MKLHGYLLIFFSNYLLASELEPRGAETYLEYVDSVLNFRVSAIEESPSGGFVYAGTHIVGNDSTDSIIVYSTDSVSGALTEVDAITQGVDGVDGLTGINDIQITNDNSCLFVTSNKLIIPFSQDGHLASFAVNSATGALSFVEAIDRLDPNNGSFTTPTKIIVSDDNNFLYMSVLDEVLAYAIDTADCQLTYLDKYSVAGGSWIGEGLAFDPSNDVLYVTVGNTGQPNSGGLALFQRDQTTGLLTQTNIYSNGVDGIQDLEYPVDLQATEDGRYLYTLAYDRDAVVVFEIDQQTGELTYDSSYVNLINDIVGLIQPSRLELSADQNFMVITGDWDDSLVVFTRNQNDGSLVYESSYYDDQDGFDYMSGIKDILLSQNGNLYTAASTDSAIQIVKTNPEIIDVIFSGGFELAQ